MLRYARDKNGNKEVAFVFRKDLSDRKIINGGEKIIDLGSSLSGKGDDLVILHNHPRNSSFSKTDIDEYFNNTAIKTISIVKNNGYVEIITKLSAISSKDLFIKKERYQRKLAPHKTDAEYKKMIPKLLAHLERKGGYHMEEIIHGLDLPDEISERNNKILMKKYGLTEEDILKGLDEIEDETEDKKND